MGIYFLLSSKREWALVVTCGVGVALSVEISFPLLASIITGTEFIRRSAIILDGWRFATVLQIFMYSLVGITMAHALLIVILSYAVVLVASLPDGIFILTDRWSKD